jgi:hypothetical protein
MKIPEIHCFRHPIKKNVLETQLKEKFNEFLQQISLKKVHFRVNESTEQGCKIN